MPPQGRKRTRASKLSRSSRNATEEISLSQVPQTPISEWILHPDAEKVLRRIRDKYGEPTSILPVDAEELFCICLGVESKYPGGMVECTNGNLSIVSLNFTEANHPSFQMSSSLVSSIVYRNESPSRGRW